MPVTYRSLSYKNECTPSRTHDRDRYFARSDDNRCDINIRLEREESGDFSMSVGRSFT